MELTEILRGAHDWLLNMREIEFAQAVASAADRLEALEADCEGRIKS
jgi:hypothetical protein